MIEIINKIETLQEDKPEVIITEDLIKQYIEDNIDFLISEIQDELIGNRIGRELNGNSK